MERRFVILERLGGDKDLLLHDNRPIAASELRCRAARFSEQIAEHRWQRLAVSAAGADALIVALAACQQQNCDLVLLRDPLPPNDPAWAAWQIQCVLGPDLEPVHTFGPRPAPPSGAIWLPTSGTTGRPKMAVHHLESLGSRVLATAKAPSAPARWLLTFHPASFAGLQVVLTALATGSALVAFSNPSIADLAQAALAHQPTHISGTPSFWRSLMMALPGGGQDLALRQITLGGEAVDQGTLDELHRAFPRARIVHIYASTEAGALFSVRDGRAGFPAAWIDSGVEGAQLRIRNGLLEILSPRAMRGYAGKPDDPLAPGDRWIVTGDLVEMKGDRVLFYGRVDNIINVGGTKVMPEQVEAVLLEHPQVREAWVFGQPNPLVGAVVCAEVVLTPGADEESVRPSLIAHAAGRLDPQKMPRILRFVPRISMNAAGKKVRQP